MTNPATEPSSAPLSRETDRNFRLEAYDFEFPIESIATQPAQPRDSSRLLVLDRKSGSLIHSHFRDLPQLMKAGDCLVLNRTKVWPARLFGRKSTGGKADILLVRELERGLWAALSSGLHPGTRIQLSQDASLEIEGLNEEGEYLCRFSTPDVLGLMASQGMAPLPPYILKSRKSTAPPQVEAPEADRGRYQTVYAREAGSIAAPTAGLHFTPDLLRQLKASGIRIAEVVLHVGRGTFRPVTAEDVREHSMLPEWFHVPPETVATIQSARRDGARIIAVGTTATRTLETLAQRGDLGLEAPAEGLQGWTNLYIGPEHAFISVDALITNFHLPRSSPLILAGAFAGRERLLAAYREAIRLGYRLYSFGDAMLVV